MKEHKIYIIIAAIIISAGLVFFGLSNRFYIDSSTRLKVDRLTGKTYMFNNGAWKEIKDSNSSDVAESKETKASVNVEESPSNSEYKNNLMMLKTNKSMHEKFINYYRDVLNEYNIDPLFIKNNNYTLGSLRFVKDYKKYSPFLSPKYIVDKLTKDGIQDPDEYIDSVIMDYYQ